MELLLHFSVLLSLFLTFAEEHSRMLLCLLLLRLLLLNALSDLDLVRESFPPELVSLVEFHFPLRKLGLHLAYGVLVRVVNTHVILLFLLQEGRLSFTA